MRRLLIVSVISLLCLIAVTALSGFPPEMDFLADHKKVSSGWHATSIVLRIILFSISFLSGVVAAIQTKDFKIKTKLTVILSILAAVMNASLIFFFADYRTYEKAHILYDTEIENFAASHESLDLSDEEIASEFRNARLDLIQKLGKIKLGVIEGKIASLEILPKLYAQEKAQYARARDEENFIYGTGFASDSTSLQRAKLKAMKNAEDSLFSMIRQQLDIALSEQKLSNKEREMILAKLMNPKANSELLKFTETENPQFNKSRGVYNYSVDKKIPKYLIGFFYVDIIAADDTLKNIKAFSIEKLEKSFGKGFMQK